MRSMPIWAKLIMRRLGAYSLGLLGILTVGVFLFQNSFSDSFKEEGEIESLAKEKKEQGTFHNKELEVEGREKVSQAPLKNPKRMDGVPRVERVEKPLKLWDYLSRKTFESVPDLLEDLGFSGKEISLVQSSPTFFKELERDQKRTDRQFEAIDTAFGLQSQPIIYQVYMDAKGFLDEGKVRFEDPHDKENYREFTFLKGGKAGEPSKSQRVFIRIDRFPELKRLRLAQILLVKGFTERMKKRVQDFLAKKGAFERKK